jgi:hypothetical protein
MNIANTVLRRAVSLIAIGVALGGATAANAVSLTDAGYSQNFDSMGLSGAAPPTDWSMFVGPSGTSNTTWTSTIPGSGVGSLIATSGSLAVATTPTTTNNNGYNAAASASATSDRVIATAPTTVSGAAIQLTLTNGTGAALNGLNLSYDTVRYSPAGSNNELPGYWLFYSLDGSNWTNVSSLNPTLATVPNTAGITQTTGALAFSQAVAPGATVRLRWVDDNAAQTSPDQLIGLNNVNIAPVPLPAALPLLLSALGGLGFTARRRRSAV